MVVPPKVLTRPFDADDSIPPPPPPPIGCFLGAFMHLLRTLPKEVSRSTANKVESGISHANRRSLVRERRVKKESMLVKKKIRSSLSQRAAEHPMQWVKKQKAGLLHRHPFERKSLSIKSQRKAKSKYGICAGFWLDRRGHKAKRSDARFISPMTKVQVNT